MNVILSYGFGVDSTAILLRWIAEPQTRDFPLKDLVVISAQTGNEWEETGRLVETHVYPLLARHGIRTVQVARKGASQTDGITVLNDTTTPTLCHIRPTAERPYYTLAAEMLTNGTIPQSGGTRKCSIKAKGWPLDYWISRHTSGAEFRHVVGFEANETSRMVRDMREGKVPGRIPSYPLIEWGWDRDACLRYIRAQLGVEWPKSACAFCPYAFAVRDGGRNRTIARYLANPEEAMLPLLMEYAAVALNPRQGLIGGERLADVLAAHPGTADLLARFAAVLDADEWGVYDVRRAFRARHGDVMRPGTAVRSIERLTTGTRTQALDYLHDLAAARNTRVQNERGYHRVWLTERGLYYPCREHALVAAPARAVEKVNAQFGQVWDSAAATPSQLTLWSREAS